MKFQVLALSLVTILAACGKSEVASDGDLVGRYREAITVPADSATVSQVNGLCQLLLDKANNFQFQHVNSTFNFTTAYSSCGSASADSAVKARLVNSMGTLSYQLLSGDNFITQVETNTAGVMSALCQGLSNLTQPLLTGSMAIWYEQSQGASCSANNNVRCMKMEVGFKQADGRYLITTIDRFQVDYSAGPLTGMVLRHDRTNMSGCDEGKSSVTTSRFISKD